MAFHVQIVDAQGNPDPVSSLADLLIEALLSRGVGLFKTSNHVAKDLRDAVNDLVRAEVITYQKPTLLKTCPTCGLDVSIWHTYSDGSVRCTTCKGIEDHE